MLEFNDTIETVKEFRAEVFFHFIHNIIKLFISIAKASIRSTNNNCIFKVNDITLTIC